jgi:hypothetical protein
MKAKTKILTGILILAASAAGIGYYLWNKKPTDVAGTKPTYTLTAAELFKSFSTDSVHAKKYLGDEKNNLVVQISGTVSEITGTDSTTSIFLKADTSGSTVQCAFLIKESSAKPGDNVTIKGMVSGFNALETILDEILPGKVVMDRCVMVK